MSVAKVWVSIGIRLQELRFLLYRFESRDPGACPALSNFVSPITSVTPNSISSPMLYGLVKDAPSGLGCLCQEQ